MVWMRLAGNLIAEKLFFMEALMLKTPNKI